MGNRKETVDFQAAARTESCWAMATEGSSSSSVASGDPGGGGGGPCGPGNFGYVALRAGRMATITGGWWGGW